MIVSVSLASGGGKMLDIRSFLTTAAMSSTGGQNSRISLQDQFDANSLW
jgi:hypothetical protein